MTLPKVETDWAEISTQALLTSRQLFFIIQTVQSGVDHRSSKKGLHYLLLPQCVISASRVDLGFSMDTASHRVRTETLSQQTASVYHVCMH